MADNKNINNDNTKNVDEEGSKVEILKKNPGCCSACQKRLQVGSLIGYVGGRYYCYDCCDEKKSAVSYYVQDTENLKLIISYNSFWQLPAGIYEIGSVSPTLDGEYYTYEAVAAFSDVPLEYLGKKKASYLIDKQGKSATLLFPAYMVLDLYDFVKNIDEYEYIIDELEYFAGHRSKVDIFFVMDKDDKVIGVTADISVPRKRMDYLIERKYRSVLMTWAELSAKSEKRLTPEKLLEYCQQRIQGQGVELKKAVYMVYMYMKSYMDGTLSQANNWMLTAPSGSGKTEFYRCIRDVFEQYDIDIPVVQIDLSQITETGYKGNDTSSIPKSVLMEAPDMGGVGICFLDEADKKCKPSFGSNGVDNNAAAQANLLTLVEGIKVDVELEGKAKKFDSSKTMFVFMGAFQDIRNEKIERATSKPQIGFMSEDENVSEADVATDIFFDELTIQDIIDFGMLEELAGRIMQVVNFHKLEEKDMRNLIASKVKDISAETGIKIRVTDEGVDGLVKIAYGNLGVRHPMNVIKELALNTVAALFFDGDFDRDKDTVVITSAEEAYVEKGKEKKKGEK